MAKKTTRSAKTARKAGPVHEPTGHARNYCQIAYEYAKAAAGDRRGKSYCKWVRLAAKRHLQDLKRKRWQFEFDPWHGNDVCDFAEKFPHVEGEWDSPTLTLEPAQIFILCCVFGWRRNATGGRRFTSVYIEMARKGAKSTLTAVIGHYCLACEGAVGPQIIIGATTGEQANKVFLPAKKMAEKTGAYREAFGVDVWARSITCEASGGFMQPINAKSSTQDGWNPHVGILDELHAHKDRGLYDVIKSAFGARKNPLLWVITTAGYNVLGVCYEQHLLVEKILDGLVQADHYFGIIFTLDEKDDPLDPTVWIKANPLLGVTPTVESMESYAQEARHSPDSMGEFKTKRLNIWTSAKAAWLNMESWKRGKAKPDLEALADGRCWAGLDLASTTDMSAFVLVWMQEGRLQVWGRYYLPEDAVWPRTERGNVPYQTWADQGLLTLTPGNVTDYEFIERDIMDSLDRFNVQAIGYDPWNATDLVNRLVDQGAPMVLVRQGARSYHPAMQEIERRNVAGTIDHGNNPVLSWMASNVVARRDANESLAPDRKNSQEKIDGFVAMAMGVVMMLHDEGEQPSVYEERGIIEMDL